MENIKMKYLETQTLKNVSVFAVLFVAGFLSLIAGSKGLPFLWLSVPIGGVVLFALLSSSSGVELDLEKGMYREYREMFGGVQGEWKSMHRITSIVKLTKSGGKIGQSLTGDNHLRGYVNELYLMDQNHIRRIFICSTKNRKIMKAKIKELQNYGFRMERYNPITSKRKR
jgi:hypothetical protein